MTRMKDSGIKWIGQIPEEWGITKIKFTTQLNGRIGWQGLTSAEYKEEGPYLITGTDFLDGKINFETAVHIDEKRWFEARQIQVENGDLLITKDGTVGKVAIIEGLNEKASLNSGVLRIQTTENISRRFLFYVLKSDVFWLWFNYTNSGASTILHLYQNVFDEFSFTFPNISEQTQIADFLDKKVAQLDKVKSLLEEQIKTLEGYRQSLIYETVTKGLDKTVPLKASGIDWIGQIPEGWNVDRLGFHIYEINEKNIPQKSDFILSLTNKDGVIPYEDKGNQGNNSKDNLLDYKLAYPDTIVANSMNILIGSVGYSNYFGCISPVYYVFKERKGTNLRFVNYIMAIQLFQKELRKYANGILEIRLRVSSEDILKRFCAFPSLSDQDKIVTYLDKRTNQINQMISIKKEQIENINKQRQTLIYDYV
ncbi:TPA: restriction endonuclease subunit S, partial [Streptococcus suis]|nr:restriction endonuclease subunit S [Streptococcus suis]